MKRLALISLLVLTGCGDSYTTVIEQAPPTQDAGVGATGGGGDGGSGANGGSAASTGGEAGEGGSGGDAAGGSGGSGGDSVGNGGSGVGGSAGQGGDGGTGGVQCIPRSCEEQPGKCGEIDDGCGNPLPCGTQCGEETQQKITMSCNPGTHLCECASAIIDPQKQGFCDANEINLCAGSQDCIAYLCGEFPNEDAPPNCAYGENQNGQHVWCCAFN